MSKLRKAGDISASTSVVLLAIRMANDGAEYGGGRNFSERATRAFELSLKARMEDLSSAGWSSLHVLTTDRDRLSRRIERARDWNHFVLDTGKPQGREWDTLLERCSLGVDFLLVIFGHFEAVGLDRLWSARNLLARGPAVVLFGEGGAGGIATRVANLRMISGYLSSRGLGAHDWEESVRNEHLSIVEL